MELILIKKSKKISAYNKAEIVFIENRSVSMDKKVFVNGVRTKLIVYYSRHL